MNSRTLGTVALVAGAIALLIGLWGLIAPGEMTSPGDVKQSIRWAGAGILAAGIAAVASALARRGR